MKKKKQIAFLLLLMIILIAINYNPIDDFLVETFEENFEIGVVERVIDGDTIVINGTSIRLLGINCPEKGEKYYSEAKKFTENLTNKTVQLHYGKEKYDLYDRILAYVFYDGYNINAELVEEGYANFYFPSGKDKYYPQFYSAWEKCIERNVNLCEKSKNACTDCIKLKLLDYKNQKIIFENICSYDCDLNEWWIKDEGRKKFYFENFVLKSGTEVSVGVDKKGNCAEDLCWKGESYVWTSTGDTLFLRDESNELVLWKSY